MTEAERPALSEAQLRVLAIYGRIDGRNQLYWGSRKTSAALAALGLVEPYLPPSVAERPRMTARPYRITAAGRRALGGKAP